MKELDFTKINRLNVMKRDLSKQLSKLNADIAIEMRILAEQSLGLKVGDRVINEKGDIRILSSLAPTLADIRAGSMGWNIRGFKIKKDGSPHKTSSFMFSDSWRKLNTGGEE